MTLTELCGELLHAGLALLHAGLVGNKDNLDTVIVQRLELGDYLWIQKHPIAGPCSQG